MKKRKIAGEEESLNNWCLGFLARKPSEYIGEEDSEGEQWAGTHKRHYPLFILWVCVYPYNYALKSVCLFQNWGHRKYHGKKSISVLEEAAIKNSEWEQGKIVLIFSILFHIELDRRGGWPDLDLTGIFSNSPYVCKEGQARGSRGPFLCKIVQSIGRMEPGITCQAPVLNYIVLYVDTWNMWSSLP